MEHTQRGDETEAMKVSLLGLSREVEPSRQGSYFGHFSAITQPILNQLTQFLERDEIRIVSSRVQNFKSIGLELTEL